MSYCRWSTHDFNCDVYCYEDVGGFIAIHVAGRRLKAPEKVPKFDRLKPSTINAQTNYLSTLTDSDYMPIELDTYEYHSDTAEEAISNLKKLRELGVVFPDYLIASIAEDFNILP